MLPSLSSLNGYNIIIKATYKGVINWWLCKCVLIGETHTKARLDDLVGLGVQELMSSTDTSIISLF